MSNSKQILARNLLYYMALTNKSRMEICKDLGVNYSTLTEWVNGHKYPRIEKIERMAEYFNISKSDLIEDKSSDIDVTVSEFEHRLLSYFFMLNEYGQEEALNHMEYLVSQDRYLKKQNAPESNLGAG